MPGYFVSYIIFIIFLFPSAWAHGLATMVTTRFIGGGASSVSINIVGGTITDIWKGDRDRSLPMSIFGMTSVIGIAVRIMYSLFLSIVLISLLAWSFCGRCYPKESELALDLLDPNHLRCWLSSGLLAHTERDKRRCNPCYESKEASKAGAQLLREV